MPRSLVAVASFLFLSGMCSLIYQVAWLRELRLVFGATTAASAATVAIFMAGLGLGNALLGKLADRRPNPLALYAILELGITLSAVASPYLIDATRAVYVAVGGQSSLGPFGATLARLLLTFLVLGVPTFLMGGTLPAAVAAVTTARDENRRRAALLYGCNTLGAVLGAFLSSFILLQYLGTRATLSLACGVNFIVVLMAWRYSLYPLASAETTPEPRKKKAKHSVSEIAAPGDDGLSSGSTSAVYFAAALLGFVFMLMELVWYRMLAPILGGTTFTFGLILALALLGIGIGGALYAVIYTRRRPSIGDLAITCALEALFIVIPFAMGDHLALWAADLYRTVVEGSFNSIVWQWTKIASIVVLPASLVSGIQFPLLIALLGKGQADVGKQIGWAYAANTGGSIVGSLAGGFGLLPLLSATGCWQAATLLLAIASMGLVAIESGALAWYRRWLAPAGLAGISLLLLSFPGPSAIWRHSGIGAGRDQLMVTDAAPNRRMKTLNENRNLVVWECDGIEAGIAITHSDSYAFFVNGKCDGSAVGDAGTQIMSGMLGAMLHPNPRHCMVVGLGTGETAGWLAQVDSVERVDVVEIEPAIDEMARRCATINHRVLEHPRVNRIYNDAREVLLTNSETYDVIFSEPSNPYRAGISSLFTTEFYRAVEHRLTQNGVFIQWLQGYEIDEQTVISVLATLKGTFPHIQIWQSKPTDMLLVCTREPLTQAYDRLPERITVEPYRSALIAGWRVNRLEGLLARYVAGDATLSKLAGQHEGAFNNDDLNHIEYGFARTVGRQTTFQVDSIRELAKQLGDHRIPIANHDVDWRGVDRERFANLAILHHVVDPTFAKRVDRNKPEEVGDYHYAQYVAHFMLAHVQATLDSWSKSKTEANSITDTGILASTYSLLGKERECLRELEKHEVSLPAEANLIRGNLYFKLNRHDEAMAYWVKGFKQLRTDPWVLSELVDLAILYASTAQENNPARAKILLDGLSEPFAAGFSDRQRRLAATVIANTIGPAEAVSYFESFEPHIPWDAVYLTKRAETYAATSHPLAARAAADLKLFQNQE